MPRTGIIKKDAVKMAGKRKLELPQLQVSSTSGPTARITEQKENAAVIEVTCTCGKRIYLDCSCADPSGQG